MTCACKLIFLFSRVSDFILFVFAGVFGVFLIFSLINYFR
jgi:hypothetical protein